MPRPHRSGNHIYIEQAVHTVLVYLAVLSTQTLSSVAARYRLHCRSVGAVFVTTQLTWEIATLTKEFFSWDWLCFVSLSCTSCEVSLVVLQYRKVKQLLQVSVCNDAHTSHLPSSPPSSSLSLQPAHKNHSTPCFQTVARFCQLQLPSSLSINKLSLVGSTRIYSTSISLSLSALYHKRQDVCKRRGSRPEV